MHRTLRREEGHAPLSNDPRLCFAVALGTHFGCGPALAEGPEDPAQRLNGMWRLVSITTNGQVNPVNPKL
jgi:hypothetical protein